MSLNQIVKSAKFDIPSNSDAANIQDFMKANDITASKLVDVECIYRSDNMQTVIIFYIDGELEDLVQPRGPQGPQGKPGAQGPKGERGRSGTDGDIYMEAVCVYYYRKIDGSPDYDSDPNHVCCKYLDEPLTFPDFSEEVDDWEPGQYYETDEWVAYSSVRQCDPNSPFDNPCCPPCKPCFSSYSSYSSNSSSNSSSSSISSSSKSSSSFSSSVSSSNSSSSSSSNSSSSSSSNSSSSSSSNSSSSSSSNSSSSS